MEKSIIFFLLFFCVSHMRCAELVVIRISDEKRKLLESIADLAPIGIPFSLSANNIEFLAANDEREAIKNFVLRDEKYKNARIDLSRAIECRKADENERDRKRYWVPIVAAYVVADLANSRANGILENVVMTGLVALSAAGIASLLEPYNSTNRKMSLFITNPKTDHWDWCLLRGFANSIIMIPVQWLFARQQLLCKAFALALEITKLWWGSKMHYNAEILVCNSRKITTLGELVNGPKFCTPGKEIQ